jgi:hypothetical protein
MKSYELVECIRGAVVERWGVMNNTDKETDESKEDLQRQIAVICRRHTIILSK